MENLPTLETGLRGIIPVHAYIPATCCGSGRVAKHLLTEEVVVRIDHLQ